MRNLTENETINISGGATTITPLDNGKMMIELTSTNDIIDFDGYELKSNGCWVHKENYTITTKQRANGIGTTFTLTPIK